MEAFKCLRCGTEMKDAGKETIQIGQTSWLLGDLPNLLAGSLDVHIWFCPTCGKIELFGAVEKENNLLQITCPRCGHQHDFDCPKCPHCGYAYYT